jgi:hypothetical protein
MTGIHVFDVVRQPTHAPTVLLPWLFTAVCCCGWVSPFQSLRESDSRDDWERHVRRRWAS